MRSFVLNGTSSSGKSCLARAIQAPLGARGECWCVFGIDDFLGKMPASWVGHFEVGAFADEGVSFARVGDELVFKAGPVGQALLAGYRKSIAALSMSGLNVIVDEVVLDEAAWIDWESELRRLHPFWVRVDCPTEVCEERERVRGDRLVGLARSQSRIVHRYPTHHVAVDTGSPTDLATAIIDAHASHRSV